MSSFIGIIDKNFAIIGTDTLTTYPKQIGDAEINPRSYTCKTFLLPQFKSAFATTGYLQAGLCFFNFATESVIGTDIISLTNVGLDEFKRKLNYDYQTFPTGSIYLIGYSDNQDMFKGYKLLIEPDNNLEWKELQSDSFIFKPIVEEWKSKVSKLHKISNYCDFIVDLMKIQKNEDEEKDVFNQIGIGGQVICTQLGFNKKTKKISIVMKIVHQFEDYFLLGNKMMKKIK